MKITQLFDLFCDFLVQTIWNQKVSWCQSRFHQLRSIRFHFWHGVIPFKARTRQLSCSALLFCKSWIGSSLDHCEKHWASFEFLFWKDGWNQDKIDVFSLKTYWKDFSIIKSWHLAHLWFSWFQLSQKEAWLEKNHHSWHDHWNKRSLLDIYIYRIL